MTDPEPQEIEAARPSDSTVPVATAAFLDSWRQTHDDRRPRDAEGRAVTPFRAIHAALEAVFYDELCAVAEAAESLAYEDGDAPVGSPSDHEARLRLAEAVARLKRRRA